jgi:hypothetical protein
MEEILLKQHKEVGELRVDNANAYQINNEIQRQADQRHAQMAFNEKLNNLLKETQKKKSSNYDTVFGENSEFNKQNTLFQIKFKALLMEEKDAYMVRCNSRHCSKGY